MIQYVPTGGDHHTQRLYLHKGPPVRSELANPDLTKAVLAVNDPLPAAISKIGKVTRWLSGRSQCSATARTPGR